MVTISKSQVAEWIILDYLAKTNNLKEKISLFVKKYNMDFAEFEKKVNTSSKENFEEWDDYIEWKAFQNFYKTYLEQIEEVKNGNFQLAS